MITRKLIALNPCIRKDKSKNSKLPSCAVLSRFSCVQLCDLWTVTCQAPMSMGFSREEYWCGLLCPPPDLPDPGVELKSPASLALQAGYLCTEPPGKPLGNSEKENQIKTQVRARE